MKRYKSTRRVPNATWALFLLCLLVPGGQAFAELCTIDAVPAATLLLPYFEVDLDANPGKSVDTLFSINNASATPTIAHISIWSDWSQPVLDFDIFLTGYDVQSLGLHNALVRGNLPVTADMQSDQGQDGGRVADLTSSCDGTVDSCSPHGDNPEWDGSFDGSGVIVPGVADCIDIFPLFVNPLLVQPRLANIQDKLTGKPIDGACYGADHGDNFARGYITIDNANACSLLFAVDPGYFSDGVSPGIASNVNQLWGDYFIVDPHNDFAQGGSLVHIEADDDFTGDGNDYTFYRRYTGPINPSEDNREPLGTTWGARYLNGGAFDQTRLIVWRDSTVTDIRESGFACGDAGTANTGPSWHPLNETQVVVFDESERFEEMCQPFQGPDGPPISPPDDPETGDPVCFPLETQRVTVGVGPLDPLYNFGWLYMNLNVGLDDPRDGEPGVDYDPSVVGTLAQSYVEAGYSALGLYSVGLPAVELTSACDAVDVLLLGEPEDP